MVRRRLKTGIAVALTLALVGPPAADAREEPLPDAAASVVKLLLRKAAMIGEGSGFVVGDGLVVTSRHVVRGAVGAEIVLADQRRFDVGEVVAVDRYWDLALLRVDAPPGALTPVTLAAAAPAVGEPVAALVQLRYVDDVENDDDAPRTVDVRRGTVSRHRPLDREGMLLRTDIPADKGDSGSPVLDAALEHVVGVVTFINTESFGQTITYSVPARHVAELVARANDAPPFAESLFHWQRASASDPEWMVENALATRDAPPQNRSRVSLARIALNKILSVHRDDDPPTLGRGAYFDHAFCFILLATEMEEKMDEEVDEEDTTIQSRLQLLYGGAIPALESAIAAPSLACTDDLFLSLSFYWRGHALYRWGEASDAIDDLERYVARDPQDADGHYLLAEMLVEEGERDRAEAAIAAVAGLVGEEAEEVAELREMLESLDGE